MITLQREKLQDMLEEFKEVLEFNYKQTASHQDKFPMNIDWDLFLALENANCFFLTTVRDEKKLIGYMSFTVLPNINFKTSKTAYTDKYVILPEYWGKGLGRKLLKATIEWSTEIKCERLFGGVRINQGEAPIKMYESEGFEKIEINMEKVLC